MEGHVKEWLHDRAAGARAQKNLMILIPREFGKTTLITNAAMIWLQLQDPELSIYIGSETKEKASKFIRPMYSVLDGSDPFPNFTTYYGNWYDKSRAWTQEQIVHAARKAISVQDPSIGVWGVSTGLVGAHPDVLVFDDPISYEKMEADGNWLDTVNQHVGDLIFVLKGNGLRIFIGTRYHDGDHLGQQLRKHGAKSVSGMSCPDVDPSEKGIWHLFYLAARDFDKKPVYPEVWNEDKLLESERENSVKYQAQMMNDPTTGRHVPLTRANIDNMWVRKKDAPRDLRISFHIDTAFKYRERQARGDESVIEIWGHARDGSGDVYFLEGFGSDTWRVEDFNSKLVQLLQEYRKQGRWPYVLTDEIEVFGKAGSWEMTIMNWCHAVNIPCPRIHLINRAGRGKVPRILTAASYWQDGRVKLIEGASGVERLVGQMLKIGFSQHDDWSDCAADVFHKEVYRPIRLRATDTDNELIRPFDDVLQEGTIPIGQLVRDFHRQRTETRPEPPIGG